MGFSVQIETTDTGTSCEMRIMGGKKGKENGYLWGWLPWQFCQVFKMTLAPLVYVDELQWFLVAPKPLTE